MTAEQIEATAAGVAAIAGATGALLTGLGAYVASRRPGPGRTPAAVRPVRQVTVPAPRRHAHEDLREHLELPPVPARHG